MCSNVDVHYFILTVNVIFSEKKTFYVIWSEHLDAIAVKKLVQFVHELMQTYFRFVEQRVRLEVTKHRYTRHAIIVSPSSGLLMLSSILQKSTGDNTILVRSLDRFHRRLQAMNHLLPDVDFSRFCDVTHLLKTIYFFHWLCCRMWVQWYEDTIIKRLFCVYE